MIRSCLAVLLLAIICQSAGAQVKKMDPAVEKLLRERVALLKEVVDAQMTNFETGRANLDDIAYARQVLFAAELELAPTSAERIKIRESLLKDLTDLENRVKAQVEAAVRPTLDFKMARATRLRAEADLLTERKAATK
jgi:hypothetical protein